MMESGTYAYQPFRYFSDRGVKTHVIHAQALRLITQSDKKADKMDAQTIARMLRLWKEGGYRSADGVYAYEGTASAQ